VVAAPNRDYLAALVFPNLPQLRARFDAASERFMDDSQFLQCHEVRAFFGELFALHNKDCAGTSDTFRRCLLLTTPPRLDHNETTDKGYINQIAVLHNRANLVEQLYQEPPGVEVIVLG
jgi:feruloyl-CoA synthase